MDGFRTLRTRTKEVTRCQAPVRELTILALPRYILLLGYRVSILSGHASSDY
jgi:hypothetical protein